MTNKTFTDCQTHEEIEGLLQNTAAEDVWSLFEFQPIPKQAPKPAQKIYQCIDTTSPNPFIGLSAKEVQKILRDSLLGTNPLKR